MLLGKPSEVDTFFTQIQVQILVLKENTGYEMYKVKQFYSIRLKDISTCIFCAKLTDPHVMLI